MNGWCFQHPKINALFITPSNLHKSLDFTMAHCFVNWAPAYIILVNGVLKFCTKLTHTKNIKMRFWPALGVHSTQTLFGIYNTYWLLFKLCRRNKLYHLFISSLLVKSYYLPLETFSITLHLQRPFLSWWNNFNPPFFRSHGGAGQAVLQAERQQCRPH